MTKSLELASSILGINYSPDKPPVMLGLEYFRDLHAAMGRQAWTTVDIGSCDDYEYRKMDVESPDFTGTIEWTISGPPDLLNDEARPSDGPFTLTISVNTPDWSEHAEIKFVRNVNRVYKLGLGSGTASTGVADIRGLDITLRANAPNGQD